MALAWAGKTASPEDHMRSNTPLARLTYSGSISISLLESLFVLITKPSQNIVAEIIADLRMQCRFLGFQLNGIEPIKEQTCQDRIEVLNVREYPTSGLKLSGSFLPMHGA